MNVGRLNYLEGLFRVWIVASGFWFIGCAVFAFAAFDRWYFATTKARDFASKPRRPCQHCPRVSAWKRGNICKSGRDCKAKRLRPGPTWKAPTRP